MIKISRYDPGHELWLSCTWGSTSDAKTGLLVASCWGQHWYSTCPTAGKSPWENSVNHVFSIGTEYHVQNHGSHLPTKTLMRSSCEENTLEGYHNYIIIGIYWHIISYLCIYIYRQYCMYSYVSAILIVLLNPTLTHVDLKSFASPTQPFHQSQHLKPHWGSIWLWYLVGHHGCKTTLLKSPGLKSPRGSQHIIILAKKQNHFCEHNVNQIGGFCGFIFLRPGNCHLSNTNRCEAVRNCSQSLGMSTSDGVLRVPSPMEVFPWEVV